MSASPTRRSSTSKKDVEEDIMESIPSPVKPTQDVLPLPLPKELAKYKHKDFEISTTLGTGTFGRVKLAQHLQTGIFYAVKIMIKSEIIRLNQLTHVQSEVDVLMRIEHPFIVKMAGFYQTDTNLCIVTEYLEGGELFSLLREQTRFPIETVRLYSSQILLAIEYLHSMGLVHRDIKPENILLTRNGYLKVVDFGFCKLVDDRTWTLCGTPEYIAPEVITSKGHGRGVDYWAFGILEFEMLAGYPPFFAKDPFGIYDKILKGAITFPRHFDAKIKNLIENLLQPDITKRFGCLKNGIMDIKMDTWYSTINWDAIYNLRIDNQPYSPKVEGEGDTSNFDSYADDIEDVTAQLTDEDAKLFKVFYEMRKIGLGE
jgi:serine/threonine protein kinase|eukprot:g15181.t1